MTNHPNRGRYTAEQIREYLLSKPGAEAVHTGAELNALGTEGDDHDADGWHVYGTMPNTDQIGWYFAGYTTDVIKDMRAEGA